MLSPLWPREGVLLVYGLVIVRRLFDIVARLCVLDVPFVQLLLALFFLHYHVLSSCYA